MDQSEMNAAAAMFKDKAHRERYLDIMLRMQSNNPEHASFAYLVSLVDAPINDCFDFENDKIKMDMLDHAWVTGTDRRVLTLAKNLWNCINSADVSDVFSYVGDFYSELLFYAIQIRFEYASYIVCPGKSN